MGFFKKHNEEPDWLKDAKFGIYFHWGIYSVPAAYNEWYPRSMHFPGRVYEHHDGFSKVDSGITPWKVMDKGPKKDITGELAQALRNRSIELESISGTLSLN